VRHLVEPFGRAEMGRSQRRQARQIPLGICLARRLAIIPIAARLNDSYLRDRTLDGQELFICHCGSAFLPKTTVGALCTELGGQPWQLGTLLLAALGDGHKADGMLSAGALIALFLLNS